MFDTAGCEPARTFGGILFAGEACVDEAEGEPAYFRDLNLDQVEACLVAGRDRYRLAPFFRTRLEGPEVIRYRQEVFADLESRAVRAVIETFAASMTEVRLRLSHAGTRYHPGERARWFLDAGREYVEGVVHLADGLGAREPRSDGLRELGSYLAGYLRGPGFQRLQDDAGRVAAGLAAVRYNVRLHGARVTVARYDDEPDLGAEVAGTFARFRPDHTPAVESRRPASATELDPLENRILDQVTLLFPDEFAALQEFSRRHVDFVDPVVGRFDREVQFYLAYLDLMAPLVGAGLRLELPQVSESKREVVRDTFDLALALRLVPEHREVVTNDLSLAAPERIWVITGPNNGGKTTIARAVGQLHHLAALGCPVPGHGVSLFLCDTIFTHFERREDPSALTGKLREELRRLAVDFSEATPRSLVIMNEMFSSTSASDALELSLAILHRIEDLDALGVCVTFLDELAGFSPKAVSLVCGIDPADPAIRTFGLERRAADGRAYARALSAKYGLRIDQIQRRMRP